MLLARGFYPDPVPGFILTAIVVALCIGVAVWIAVREFGPGHGRH